jgi:hypothetical protein
MLATNVCKRTLEQLFELLVGWLERGIRQVDVEHELTIARRPLLDLPLSGRPRTSTSSHQSALDRARDLLSEEY